jgi:hypothetical protein
LASSSSCPAGDTIRETIYRFVNVSGTVNTCMACPGQEKFPPESEAMMGRMMEIMKPVKTHDQQVFRVKIEGENIIVNLKQ